MKKPNAINMTCSDTKYPKMCGNISTEAYCIPSSSKCPITDVSFDTEGNLVTSTDPSIGAPIIEVWLSEGGPPCADYKNNLNSITNKTGYPNFSDNYKRDCPSITLVNDTFKTSRLFTEVEGFQPVSEYTLLSENESKSGIFSAYKIWDLL